mmetsp:Transcript_54859/g.123804  ORF Transcript_54859/g.123804 Transcript_54859/m.123804 type:complete len:206 (-) Transcript_54859:537-1154(-)
MPQAQQRVALDSSTSKGGLQTIAAKQDLLLGNTLCQPQRDVADEHIACTCLGSVLPAFQRSLGKGYRPSKNSRRRAEAIGADGLGRARGATVEELRDVEPRGQSAMRLHKSGILEQVADAEHLHYLEGEWVHVLPLVASGVEHLHDSGVLVVGEGYLHYSHPLLRVLGVGPRFRCTCPTAVNQRAERRQSHARQIHVAKHSRPAI